MDDTSKKGKLGHQRVADIIEGADLGGGIKLSMTLAELCEKCHFLPEVVTDNPVLQRYYDERIFSVFFYGPALAEAKQLFGKNPYFGDLKDAYKSMILLLKHNIKTLDDWATQPHPPGIDSNVRGILDAAVLEPNIRVLEVSRTEPLKTRDSPYQLPKGEDSSALYRAITQATYEAFTTVRTAGDNEEDIENRVECAKLMEPPGVMDAWRPDETLRVLTLNSKEYKKGWPCDRREENRQLCVRKEDERIFQRLFGRIGDTDNKTYMQEHGAFIVGSRGIGKTYMSCSFLWRLLTRDVDIPEFCSRGPEKYDMTRVRKLRYILYTAFEAVYLFDKETGLATRHEYKTHYHSVNAHFCSLCDDGAGCIRLYDCCKGSYIQQGDHVPTILFSSPVKDHYHEFEKSSGKIIMNAWDVDELCAWSKCSGLEWETVKERALKVGCIPRFLLSNKAYEHRMNAVRIAVNSNEALTLHSYTPIVDGQRNHASHVLMNMAPKDGTNVLSSEFIARCIQERAISLGAEEHLKWCLRVLLDDYAVSEKAFERGVLHVCSYPSLFMKLIHGCKRLPVDAKSATPVVDDLHLQQWLVADVPSRAVLYWQEGDAVEKNVLYIAKSASFPVIGAFALCDGASTADGTLFIGIRGTLASEYTPTREALGRFKRVFDGITSSVAVDKQIIVYAHHCRKTGVTAVQKCPEAAVEFEGFWEKFTQYSCCMGGGFRKGIQGLTRFEGINDECLQQLAG